MQAKQLGPFTVVSLSRRNLEALLAMLDGDDERGEEGRALHRRVEDGTILTVIAEENAEHYGERQAGHMHEYEAKVSSYQPPEPEPEQPTEEHDIARFEGDGGAVWPEDD
jgi:hypothetical protein